MVSFAWPPVVCEKDQCTCFHHEQSYSHFFSYLFYCQLISSSKLYFSSISVDNHPVLKADAIKYLIVFRNMVRFNHVFVQLSLTGLFFQVGGRGYNI